MDGIATLIARYELERAYMDMGRFDTLPETQDFAGNMSSAVATLVDKIKDSRLSPSRYSKELARMARRTVGESFQDISDSIRADALRLLDMLGPESECTGTRDDMLREMTGVMIDKPFFSMRDAWEITGHPKFFASE